MKHFRNAAVSLGTLLTALVLTHAGAARADGTVYRGTGCGDRLYVASGSQYSELITDGASGAKDGDLLAGDVERIGSAVLFDRTSGRSIFAQVTDRHLSLAEIAPRIAAHCRSALGNAPISGYVSRANGCGNRIFVNTPQGYAVLERLSGGIVADGDTLQGDFNRPGRATVEDRQSGSRLVVFVHDLWLSRSAVERRISRSCLR